MMCSVKRHYLAIAERGFSDTKLKCKAKTPVVGDLLSDLFDRPLERQLYLKSAFGKIMYLSNKLTSLESSSEQRAQNVAARQKLLMGDESDDIIARSLVIYRGVGENGSAYLSAVMMRVQWLSKTIESQSRRLLKNY